MMSTEQIVEQTVRTVLARMSQEKNLSGTGGTQPSGDSRPKGFYATEKSAMATPNHSPVPSPKLAHPAFDITLDFAEMFIKQVEKKAKEMGLRVVTAVSDSHGNPVAVRCMDGAYPGSFDVALNKTYTAIAFQMSTEELGRLSQPSCPLYGIQFTNQGRIVIFGGGILLKTGDTVIGAFGVSGGSAEEDTYLAHYAEQKFQELCSREEFRHERTNGQ